MLSPQRCFLLLVLALAPLVDAIGQNHGWISSNRKSAFVDHLTNFVSNIIDSTISNATTTPRSSPAGANIPVVTTTGQNPTEKGSMLAISLMKSIAPPAVRPCFIRPSFCPATSDACSTSRCAKLYANGVRIGIRFYRRVKCRLNYCRETCGKAEWYADGRRLVGCSDSSNTLDMPIWAMEKAYPGSKRLDSNVLPIEREANTVQTPSNGMGVGGVRFNTVVETSRNTPSKRSIHEWIGDIGDAVKTHSTALASAIGDKFNELTGSRRDEAIARAKEISNLTDYVDGQLDEATAKKVAEAPGDVDKNMGSLCSADLWLLLFLVAFLRFTGDL